jgi:hypothetical protein
MVVRQYLGKMYGHTVTENEPNVGINFCALNHQYIAETNTF